MKSTLSLILSACATIFIAALMGPSGAYAQTTAIFHLKDSTKQQVEIVANSKDEVFIAGGSIKLKSINRVELSNDTYKEYFTRNNIPVSINMSIVPLSPVVVPKTAAEKDLDQLYEALERFRFQRTSGKALQLAGVLLVGASAVMASREDPNAELVGGLALGGAIVSTTGFIIDLNASKHLKFKRANR